jgi:DNA-directed RNA polymerase specialized sigma24 family protein
MSKLQLKAADLGAFMQEHQGRIYNAALNLLQNQLEAEEVTQDVFLEAYNKQQKNSLMSLFYLGYQL